MDIVRESLSKLLREVADKLDANASEIEEEQALEVMKLIAHYPISKESAAIELHIHPSRFDTLIREGKIPKGRKIIGFKEKRWFLDEIQNSKYAKSLTK